MAPPPGKRRADDDGHAIADAKRPKPDTAPSSKFACDAQHKLTQNFGEEVGLKAKRQRDQQAVINSDDEDEENPEAEKAIDSDDDEVVEKENAEDVGARRLNMSKIKRDKFEGEADTTVQEEDGQQFTAFNLNEEKEEGRFDKYGNYERVYEKEQTHDAWADSVEWSKEQIEKNAMKRIETQEAANNQKENEIFDEVAGLRTLVACMQPKETVLAALRRLGASSAPKAGWKTKKEKKKAAASAGGGGTAPTERVKEAAKAAFATLTDAADNLLRSGHVTVYDDTYEKLSHLAKTKAEESASGKLDQVMWEYRTENKPESELYGPYTSQQMCEWQQQGSLSNGCWARRILPNGDRSTFYDSKRIEFDDWV